MSDVMFYGVLRMPYELAMSDELSRRQFYSRAQEAASRVERLEAELAELTSMHGSAGAYRSGSPETRAQIDEAIARADGIMATARESRDRRKVEMPYQASGLPDRRQSDRRSRNRE